MMSLHLGPETLHLILDSDSLKSYHAIGRNDHRVDFNGLILTEE